MEIKIAFQTILWGSLLDNWREVFKVIKYLGYSGVEIAQAPAVLPPIDELLDYLKELDLEFVGFSGGRLLERVEYCKDFRPEYLYIEDWDENSCPKALDNRYSQGFTLALHPHMYRPINSLKKASELLEAHPELKFLPDTAHLYLAGDDPSEAIENMQISLLVYT